MDVEEWDELQTNKVCDEIRMATSAPTVRCIKLEKEIDSLRLSLIDMHSDLDRSNDANVKLAYENDDLRAQLAEHEKNAEILRCAKEQGELVDVKGGNLSMLNYQNACVATCDAVRTREEAGK